MLRLGTRGDMAAHVCMEARRRNGGQYRSCCNSSSGVSEVHGEGEWCLLHLAWVQQDILHEFVHWPVEVVHSVLTCCSRPWCWGITTRVLHSRTWGGVAIGWGREGWVQGNNAQGGMILMLCCARVVPGGMW